MKIFLAIFTALTISACSSAGYTGEQYPTKIKLEKERGYSNDNNRFANH
ncbi:Lipoprotein [Vibrio crassostreae]|nr:Lipoprotein [Vibrio crassostreae]CAK3301197.1 Lipoprotein [Vibrio crassostreae]